MKKILLTTAIVMSFGTTAAFAHHPAEGIVDDVTYEMIDDNVSDIHADMTFDDMASDDNIGGDLDVGGVSVVGGAAESRDAEVGNAGDAMGGDIADVGAEMSGDLPDVGAAEESREEMNAAADSEASGPMGANAQR